MTRPLSHEEKLWAFGRATCSMEGAKERWAQRAARGLTDEQLAEALRFELGIYGGFSGPDSLSVTYQGAGLKIWASWETHNTVTDAPAFKGAATVATARQVYGIRNPENKQLALF
ncbi:MAG TPA: hypothetical protein VEU62_10265 [Bryobacterales bacterium]|nr:hypothetical protein [Bryobacterales bacterium]